MTHDQPVLDLFETSPEAIVPCCSVCGARGEPIQVEPIAVPDLYAASQWALLAIHDHVREMHPEHLYTGRVLCSECGLLLGRATTDEHYSKLAVAVRPHLEAHGSAATADRETLPGHA